MIQEIRLALRLLIKNPLFALVGILTLALGIGATTGGLHPRQRPPDQPLPYQDPARLVLALRAFPRSAPRRHPGLAAGVSRIQKHPQEHRETRRLQHHDLQPRRRRNVPERIFGATVSADLFPLLGVQPIRGRTFRPEECAAGRDDVLVISERLWRRKFDRDPRVLGSKIARRRPHLHRRRDHAGELRVSAPAL